MRDVLPGVTVEGDGMEDVRRVSALLPEEERGYAERLTKLAESYPLPPILTYFDVPTESRPEDAFQAHMAGRFAAERDAFSRHLRDRLTDRWWRSWLGR